MLHIFLSFSRGKGDPNSVLRSMAHKITALNQIITENIDDSLRNYGKITSSSLGGQFKTFLREPLLSSAKNESNDPLIDGLDDCGTPQSRNILLQIFKKELHTVPSKCRSLVTCKLEADILPLLSLPSPVEYH